MGLRVGLSFDVWVADPARSNSSTNQQSQVTFDSDETPAGMGCLISMRATVVLFVRTYTCISHSTYDDNRLSFPGLAGCLENIRSKKPGWEAKPTRKQGEANEDTLFRSA